MKINRLVGHFHQCSEEAHFEISPLAAQKPPRAEYSGNSYLHNSDRTLLKCASAPEITERRSLLLTDTLSVPSQPVAALFTLRGPSLPLTPQPKTLRRAHEDQ